MNRVRRVTEGLIDDEQDGLRSGRGCADQILTIKEMGEKAREKKPNGVCRFYGFGGGV